MIFFGDPRPWERAKRRFFVRIAILFQARCTASTTGQVGVAVQDRVLRNASRA